MSAIPERFMQKAIAIVAALPNTVNGERAVLATTIAAFLAKAEREGMKRAAEIAQAESNRLHRLKTEADIIAEAIMDECRALSENGDA